MELRGLKPLSLWYANIAGSVLCCGVGPEDSVDFTDLPDRILGTLESPDFCGTALTLCGCGPLPSVLFQV